MRELGLVAVPAAAVPAAPPRSPGTRPAPRTWWRRDFTATAPGPKLVGDITYIRTWEGWLYLATVLDCHTKQVIGYAMAEHLRTSTGHRRADRWPSQVASR